MQEKKIESYRNFSNKLWNIGRYITTQKCDTNITSYEITSPADTWIISKLNKLIDSTTKHLENYKLSQAGEDLRDFTWNEFADWYVETHKIQKNDVLLVHVYKTLLKLWHPFIPFVTETIWQEMFEEDKMLMVTNWPQIDTQQTSQYSDTEFETVRELIVNIRNIRATYKVNAGAKVDITLISKNADLIQGQEELIKRLAKVENITILDKDESQKESASDIFNGGKLYVHLSDIIDIEKEKKRLTEDVAQTQKYIKSLEGRLSNEQFTKKAPPQVVQQERDNLKHAETKVTELSQQLSNLTN
jgi:valyl-tRNA synthetase